MVKLTSDDCCQAILADLPNQTVIFQEMYERRKDLTTANLDRSKTPKECTSVFDLVYDESTRKPTYIDWQDLKTRCIARANSKKKPWTRWSKKIVQGENERSFSINGIWDYVIYVYDTDGIISRIEYKKGQ